MQLPYQLRHVVNHSSVKQLVIDMAILVRENVALADDRPPGHFRMCVREFNRNPACRFADNFHDALDGADVFIGVSRGGS